MRRIAVEVGTELRRQVSGVRFQTSGVCGNNPNPLREFGNCIAVPIFVGEQ